MLKFLCLFCIIISNVIFANTCDTLVQIEKDFFDYEAKFYHDPSLNEKQKPKTQNFRQIGNNFEKIKSISYIDWEKKYKPNYKIFLISMVKDEEDIYYYNLLWHYHIGVRNFFIIENCSSDQTLSLILKFKKETYNVNDPVNIIIIKDKRIDFRQKSRMNAAIATINQHFPKIDWIFPNDADEMIIVHESLSDILAKVDPYVDALYLPRFQYKYIKSQKINPAVPFFKQMNYVFLDMNGRKGRSDPWYGKTIFRSKLNAKIAQGNHFLIPSSSRNSKEIIYANGYDFGFSIREFPLRSLSHTKQKIINMGIAFVEKRKVDALYKHRMHQLTYADRRYELFDQLGMKGIEKIFTDTFSENAAGGFKDPMRFDKLL